VHNLSPTKPEEGLMVLPAHNAQCVSSGPMDKGLRRTGVRKAVHKGHGWVELVKWRAVRRGKGVDNVGCARAWLGCAMSHHK
jgi:hypothetical protein